MGIDRAFYGNGRKPFPFFFQILDTGIERMYQRRSDMIVMPAWYLFSCCQAFVNGYCPRKF